MTENTTIPTANRRFTTMENSKKYQLVTLCPKSGPAFSGPPFSAHPFEKIMTADRLQCRTDAIGVSPGTERLVLLIMRTKNL